jgi:uncharacterized protein
MQFTEVEFQDVQPIDGFGPGFFRIGGKVYEGSLLVQPNSVVSWGGYEDSAALMALEVDVLFFGTGAETAFIPRDLREALEKAGIGVEPMASPAACRTYNVLLAEGRRIAAALLPV